MHHCLVTFEQGNVGHDPNEHSLFNVARRLWLTAFDGNEKKYHRSRRQWLLQDEYSNEELINEFWLLFLFMFAWYRSTGVIPITAPARKISGLEKSEHTHSRKQYIFSVLWQAYIQYCVLWRKYLHLLMDKNSIFFRFCNKPSFNTVCFDGNHLISPHWLTGRSPWYHRTGWLGVKHQLTYLLTFKRRSPWYNCTGWLGINTNLLTYFQATSWQCKG